METQLSTQSHPDMIHELRQCAAMLTEKLQSDDYEEATKLIESVVHYRDQHIFQSVGKLTRGLHDAIINFNVDGGVCDKSGEHTDDCEFNDASNRLHYVIELTQNAAEKTMDMVEESAPISIELSEEAASLKKEWARLRQREMSPDEFRELYTRLDDFFEKMDTSTSILNKNLQNIILEQGFQDLTGQVLKRVIGLVSEVEENLVSLVRIAGQVESVVGIDPEKEKEKSKVDGRNISGEGPQIHVEERTDVVNSQDEVDDLLSSLGF